MNVMLLSQGIPKGSRVHHVGTLNVCFASVPVHPVDVEIFLQGVIENLDLLVVPDEKSGNQEVNMVHLLGAMNVSTDFHGNQSKSCCAILVWTKVVERSTIRVALLSLEPCCYHGQK